MNMKVAELRAITDRLFTYLEETGRGEFEVSEDYYWVIPQEDVYDPNKDPDPKDFTIGQLSEDWDMLKALLHDDSLPIGYALVWLSSIVRIIGEKSVY